AQAVPAAMGRLMAVSETVRGEPAENVKTASGQALAVDQTAAFWTPLRQSVVDAFEAVGQDALDCFATFGDQQRVIEVEGEQGGMEALSFLGGQLASVRRVRVEVGGPAAEGPTGRRAMLDLILEKFPGRLSADDAVEFLRLGTLEPVLDAEAGTDELVAHENE